MSRKLQLWVISKNGRPLSTISGQPGKAQQGFTDKMQAKHERDRMGGVGKGYHVSPGPDHWKSHEPIRQYPKSKSHRAGANPHNRAVDRSI